MANIVNYKKGDSYSLSARSGKPVDVNCIYELQTLCDGSKMLDTLGKIKILKIMQTASS